MGGFAQKMAAASAAVTASFGGMLKLFDSTGSELKDMSAATGISVENLSFLKYAAEQSSTSLGTITKAAKNLLQKGINPDQFLNIASSIAAVKDPTERAQAAFEVFGKKAGFAILPLLEDLPALKTRFEQLGGSFTDKMAKAADALGDSLGDLKLGLSNLTFAIAQQLAPAVTQFNNFVAEHMTSIRAWIAENGTLVKAIAFTAFGITVVTPIIYAMDKAVKVLTTSFTALNTVLTSGALAKIAAALGLAGGWELALVVAAAGGLAYGGLKLMQYMDPAKGAGGPAAASGASNTAVSATAKNTATTNDKLDELIRATQTRGPQISVAGVR